MNQENLEMDHQIVAMFGEFAPSREAQQTSAAPAAAAARELGRRDDHYAGPNEKEFRQV